MLQHNRRSLGAGTPETDVIAMMQPGQGLIQRRGQPRQRIPVSCGSSWNAGDPAPQPDSTQRGQRSGFALAQSDPAIPATFRPKVPRWLLVRAHPGRQRRRHGGHGEVSCPGASGPVSMPIRHAWICVMEEFSFADNSRPDRWMYCSVESVLR